MSLVRVGVAALVLCLADGCVLHARQFLPSTGRYVSIREGDSDGGWRSDALVVTDERGPLVVSARVWGVDAGATPSLGDPGDVIEDWIQDTALRAAIIVMNPGSGALESVPGSTLLPEPVVVGARWRVRAGDSAACYVEEEIVAVIADTARVAHRFGCGEELPVPFMNSVWQIGAGQIEFALADGGGLVRFVRSPP